MMLKYALFGLLLFIGSLNREMTGILLLLSWLVLYGITHWLLSLLYIAITVGTITGLRFGIGIEQTEYTVAYMLAYNLDEWRWSFAIFNHVLLLPLWIFIGMNRQKMPAMYSRLLWIVIPYIILLFFLASWREVRLLLPIALLLLPFLKIRSQ